MPGKWDNRARVLLVRLYPMSKCTGVSAQTWGQEYWAQTHDASQAWTCTWHTLNFHPPSLGHSKSHGQRKQLRREVGIFLPKTAREYLLNNYLLDHNLLLFITEFIFLKRKITTDHLTMLSLKADWAFWWASETSWSKDPLLPESVGNGPKRNKTKQSKK